MKPLEIEAWALRLLEQVESGSFVEDSLVELKSEWPEAKKTARQLAGHANAARGARILWLIGADEKRGIVGASFNELASWHSQLETEFDGIAPSLFSLNVPWQGKTVCALLFETERAPFVVKNSAFNTPGGGPVSLEVPWREGTRTRSASRNDLIRLLEPIRLQPTVEVLGGTLTVKPKQQGATGKLTLSAYIIFYITPRDSQPVVFPFHKASAVVRSSDNVREWCFQSLDFQKVSERHLSVAQVLQMVSSRNRQAPVTVHTRPESLEITENELIVRRPGKLVLVADASLSDSSVENASLLNFSVSLIAALAEASCCFSCACVRSAKVEGQPALWAISSEKSLP
jgi:hypothetical protein